MNFLFKLFLFLIICSVFSSCKTTDTDGNGNDNVLYEASKEEYNQTFAEVEFFMKKIHSIILNKDFNGWKRICTNAYLNKYSSHSVLQELSEKPQLKEQNIKLLDLKDYFLEVFIPSRRNTRVDKIEFITKTKVKALSIISEKAYLIYYLEKDENNQWKIDIW